MMPGVPGSAFRRHSLDTGIDPNIRAGVNQSAHNFKVTAAGRDHQWRFNHMIIAVHIRIGFGLQQGLHAS